MRLIECEICHEPVATVDQYPAVGDAIACPHCKTQAYGTYDALGQYVLEWYEEDDV
jgi:hypothetical protein